MAMSIGVSCTGLFITSVDEEVGSGKRKVEGWKGGRKERSYKVAYPGHTLTWYNGSIGV